MKEKIKHHCPYCDSPIEDNLCPPCQIKFITCKNCGQIMAESVEQCSKCGAENKEKNK